MLMFVSNAVGASCQPLLQALKGPQQHKELCDSVRMTRVKVDGVLTEAEAARFVETAERNGFEHQGSRGAAFGEVKDTSDILLSDVSLRSRGFQTLSPQNCPPSGGMLAVQNEGLL